MAGKDIRPDTSYLGEVDRGLERRERRRTLIAAEQSASGGATRVDGGYSEPTNENPNHSELADIVADPSAVTDHNVLYHTKTEMASTGTGEGASLIGIEDAADSITATTVEGALAEIAAAIVSITYASLTGRPWTLSANTIYFASPSYHMELVKSSGGTLILGYVTGDANPRFSLTSDGELYFGVGSAAMDTSLSRISANLLGMATGDGFRAENLLQLKRNAISTPAGVPTGYVNIQVDGDGRPRAIDEDDNVHDLTDHGTVTYPLADNSGLAVPDTHSAGAAMSDGYAGWTVQFSATSGSTPYISNNYAQLSIAVQAIGGEETLLGRGSIVNFGAPVDRTGNTAWVTIRARLGGALGDSDALTDVLLYLCEEGSATNRDDVDLMTTAGSGSTTLSTTWQYWTLEVDMSSWTAMGTTKGLRWGVQVRAGQTAPTTMYDETVKLDFELVSVLQRAA